MATVDDVSTAENVPVIENVTVAGITGAIGVPVISAFHDTGFSVRALTRSPITAGILLSPPGVEVLEVDYTNYAQLCAALRGQDAVISALGDTAPAVAAQEALIHASTAVRVKRFFPSEFGSDTLNPRADPEFSYTIVITGPFLDWGLNVVPFIINVGTASADVFDGGAVPFSTTRIATLAAALVSCLRPRNLGATANRTLYVHDCITTQNELIALASSSSSSTTSPSSPARAFSRKEICTANLDSAACTAHADPAADPLSWILAFVNLPIRSIPALERGQVEAVLREEVERARRAFDAGVSGGGDGVASAEKAFEEEKGRLEGVVGVGRARSGSQVERLVGEGEDARMGVFRRFEGKGWILRRRW